MNSVLPVFNRNNSYICQYLETCVINKDIEEIKCLFIKNGFDSYKNKKEIKLEPNEVDQLFERILNNINFTKPEISDYSELKQNHDLHKYLISLQRFHMLKKKVEKSVEEKHLFDSIQFLSQIPTGKFLTPEMILKYINLMSQKYPEIIPVNFTLKYNILKIDSKHDPELYDAKFSINLLSSSFNNDVYKPIEEFVLSKNPEKKLFMPALLEFEPDKIYWTLFVLDQHKYKMETSGKIVTYYLITFFTPVVINGIIRYVLKKKIQEFFEDQISKNVNDIKTESKTKSDLCIKCFLKDWSIIGEFYSSKNPIKINLNKTKDDNIGSDSGVVIIEYIRHITEKIRMKFTRENIPFFRERILKEIYSNQIIAPVIHRKDRHEHLHDAIFPPDTREELYNSNYAVFKELESII